MKTDSTEMIEDKQTEQEEAPQTNRKLQGVGVFRGNEAVDCLKRIPKNDALRKRGFQIVLDFMLANP